MSLHDLIRVLTRPAEGSDDIQQERDFCDGSSQIQCMQNYSRRRLPLVPAAAACLGADYSVDIHISRVHSLLLPGRSAQNQRRPGTRAPNHICRSPENFHQVLFSDQAAAGSLSGDQKVPHQLGYTDKTLEREDECDLHTQTLWPVWQNYSQSLYCFCFWLWLSFLWSHQNSSLWILTQTKLLHLFLGRREQCWLESMASSK